MTCNIFFFFKKQKQKTPKKSDMCTDKFVLQSTETAKIKAKYNNECPGDM